jgi:ABC-type transporter Mla MlaB component
MHSPVRFERGRLFVDGEMTVYTCSDLKSRLLTELTEHADATELDLSGVVEIDTAGL